jgi:hypothetical protein
VRSVLNMAQAMLLHASCKYRDSIDASPWPMAIKYAVYLFNYLPNAQQLSPAEIFIGTKAARHQLLSIHVWGCPVYVLDPKLQAGPKFPDNSFVLDKVFLWGSEIFTPVRSL